MSVNFGSGVTVVTSFWTTFKAVVVSKSLSMQYVDDGVLTTVFAFDGSALAYEAVMYDGGLVPDSLQAVYSVAQNNSDLSDFTTNYQPTSNLPVALTPFDPRYIHRFGNLTSTSASEVLMCLEGYTEQSSQAQRSVVSTSTQDKSGGTGAAAVTITYLDSNYVVHTETVSLNGTTAVNTVGTTIRFIESMIVSQGAAAAGHISLMSATGGGGSAVCGIGAGTSGAFLCHHYVPAGKKAFIIGWGATTDHNANFKLYGQSYNGGSSLVDYILDLENLTGIASPPGILEFYRSFPAPIPLGQKVHARITVVPGSVSSTIERSVLDIWEIQDS